MEPLALTDARHAATVERWLDAWLETSGRATFLVGPNALLVGILHNGRPYTRVPLAPMEVHTDLDALVAYVVSWARNQR